MGVKSRKKGRLGRSVLSFDVHYPTLILIGNKWNWFTQIKTVLPLTVIDDWSLPVLISPQEPFVTFPLPCQVEDGSDRAAWVGPWHPPRGRMNKIPAGSCRISDLIPVKVPLQWPQLSLVSLRHLSSHSLSFWVWWTGTPFLLCFLSWCPQAGAGLASQSSAWLL